jgi:membrane protein required for colicin V production
MAFNFSILDYGILAVMLVSVLTGFSRGFVRELFAIGLWVIALWTASHYSDFLASYLKPWIVQQQLRSIIAFIAVTAVFLIMGGLIVSTLSFLIRKSGLSGTDRLLGMVFGIFRAIFVVGLVIVAMNYSGVDFKNYEQHSKFYPQFKPVVAWLETFLPNWVNQIKQFDKTSHDLVMAKEVQQQIALNDLNHLKY